MADGGSLNLKKLRELEKKAGIQPLEPVDHSKVNHRPFTKNFYVEHPEVESMSVDEVSRVRKDRQIFVKGELVPKPLISFNQLLDKVVDHRIIDRLASLHNILEPTPI